MKKLFVHSLSLCLVLSAFGCIAQTPASPVEQMKSSYSGSGTIVALDDQTLLIEPNMPGPVCALPSNADGKTTWSFYSFPLASITVPLALIDDTLISEDLVFTSPGAAKSYKPGDVGDTTMVVVVGIPGKQFHTISYDRQKLASLGPGPHNASEYGNTPDNVEAFGLTFSDRAAARAFVVALRKAVMLARTETAQR